VRGSQHARHYLPGALGTHQHLNGVVSPVQVLNKPLDGLAAAAGGLAAAVRGSPGSAARKDRKLCGARPEGVKGRTVPWESPFGGSSASPEVGWCASVVCAGARHVLDVC
jgi:hypothetical protein